MRTRTHTGRAPPSGPRVTAQRAPSPLPPTRPATARPSLGPAPPGRLPREENEEVKRTHGVAASYDLSSGPQKKNLGDAGHDRTELSRTLRYYNNVERRIFTVRAK